MLIAAYRRVSTERQGRSGLGLEAQKQAIEAWLASRAGAEVEWYADEGVSGRRQARPQLDAMLRRLEEAATAPPTPPGGDQSSRGPTTKSATTTPPVLVVASLDRLTRSVVHLGHLMGRLNRAGITLVVLREAVDTSTVHGRLVANLLVSVAEWESELASERTKAARAVVRSRGGALGGRPAVPAHVVALARSTPGPLSVRARALEAAGYRTSSGRPYGLTQVRRMLREEAA